MNMSRTLLSISLFLGLFAIVPLVPVIDAHIISRLQAQASNINYQISVTELNIDKLNKTTQQYSDLEAWRNSRINVYIISTTLIATLHVVGVALPLVGASILLILFRRRFHTDIAYLQVELKTLQQQEVELKSKRSSLEQQLSSHILLRPLWNWKNSSLLTRRKI